MKSELQNKIDNALKILKMAEKKAELHAEPVELAYSGGKDSDVLLQLAKESGINYKAFYKNTTIDPPGTLQHVRENVVEVIQPKISFFHLIEKKGFPSFRFRFCCQALKEYKILNTAVWGVRADESPKRRARYKSFNFCRVYSAKDKVSVFAPLVDWTTKDVADFVKDRKLKLAPCYYDESGNIDFSRRLGCLACPLKNDRGVKDFSDNHALLRAYLRAGRKFFENHYSNQEKFKDVYELFLFRTFFKNTNDFILSCKSDNLFSDTINAKEFLENYFKTDLTL
jgi:phosphoadenosine phosphosulfate reductase